ncbi:protein FAR-RED ELONGATED HYPOCOTYL 3-like [Arachis hypogaea]|uniref:protein FAR-RED ELONGATED HYPOCOTYL 3-like n=1 Tax=Arachis hypogaea TaxID=3818 RepID=UPI003B2251FD
MKEKNQNFFFELNLEGNHCIKHAFGVDARSKPAFDYFGDVVSFDTTYNTNRYNLVLGSFVGMNHHDHLTLLGCALMKKRTSNHSNGYLSVGYIAWERRHQKKLERFSYKVWPWRQQVAFRTVRGSPYMNFGLLGAPLLGRDEKHAKERDNRGTVSACFTTYEVIEQVSNSKFNKFVVTYNAVSQDVKCHCLLFESRGILCRHPLSVLSFERVDNVASKYILERWSKNIKRRHTHSKSSQDEPLLEPRSKRFDELVFRSHNICEFTSDSEELTEILHRAFDKVMAEMGEYQGRSKGKSLLNHEEATLSNVNDLQSPPRVKTRDSGSSI